MSRAWKERVDKAKKNKQIWHLDLSSGRSRFWCVHKGLHLSPASKHIALEYFWFPPPNPVPEKNSPPGEWLEIACSWFTLFLLYMHLARPLCSSHGLLPSSPRVMGCLVPGCAVSGMLMANFLKNLRRSMLLSSVLLLVCNGEKPRPEWRAWSLQLSV